MLMLFLIRLTGHLRILHLTPLSHLATECMIVQKWGKIHNLQGRNHSMKHGN